MRKIFFITLLIVMLLSGAKANGAEWKFVGSYMLLKGEKTLAYYDTASVEYISDGKVRVWTKAITQAEFERILKKKEKQIIETSGSKLAKQYYPPYVLLNPETSFDQYIDIISWEEVANDSEIIPRLKTFFEINCREKKLRVLSITYFNNDGGVVTSSKEAGEWAYISPESNGETLKKILCARKK
jgi:hypothetical protein